VVLLCSAVVIGVREKAELVRGMLSTNPRRGDISSSTEDDTSDDSLKNVDEFMQSLPLCYAEVHLLRNGKACVHACDAQSVDASYFITTQRTSCILMDVRDA
jgi:hypothetical protein